MMTINRTPDDWGKISTAIDLLLDMDSKVNGAISALTDEQFKLMEELMHDAEVADADQLLNKVKTEA